MFRSLAIQIGLLVAANFAAPLVGVIAAGLAVVHAPVLFRAIVRS